MRSSSVARGPPREWAENQSGGSAPDYHPQMRNLHDAASTRFRERRMKLFMRLLDHVRKPATLLDVGGTVDFWRGRIPSGFTVTILNLHDQEPMKGVQVLVGDGCDLARFDDDSVDVVVSHSVLAFAGGWKRQQQMSREIRRVGRRYFVQTPNQGFPLDWRSLVPFFHWLPPSAQAWWFRRIRVGRYKKARDAKQAAEWARLRDLTASELEALFPEGTIVCERVLGATKSFMVHSGFGPAG
jgi:Methyltransferase domain